MSLLDQIILIYLAFEETFYLPINFFTCDFILFYLLILFNSCLTIYYITTKLQGKKSLNIKFMLSVLNITTKNMFR